MPKEDEVAKTPDDVKPEAEPSEEPEFKTPEDEAFEEVQAEVKAAEDEAAKTGGEPEKPADAENKENEKVAAAAEPTPGAAVEPVKGQDDPKAEDEGEGDKRMVPIAALHESRSNLRESELARARLEGMLAASQQLVTGDAQTPGQPAQPTQTPENQVAALNSQIDDLWQKGDDGELSLVEIRKQERVIEGQIRTIQGDGTVRPQGQQAPQMDATVEQNLVRLEADYPVITTLTDVAMAEFVKQAYESSEAEGKPIGAGALETMRLHNLAAKHAHDHYGKFYPQSATPAAPAAQPQTPAVTTPVGLSEAAQARSAKMDLAANHPPNINSLGTSADGQMSDEQVASKMEGMSEDEAIEFLDTMPGLAKRLGVTMPGPT